MSHVTQARRLLLNLVLLLLLVGLGGMAWWYSQQPEPQAETLLSLTRADITRVTITRELGREKPDIIRLEREGERWRMLEPKQVEANATRVSQLFTLLDESVAASYESEGKDLSQYGLTLGGVSIAFNDEVLQFGIENPVSRKRYVLHAGKIKLVSEAVYGLLTGEATALVANKLVPEGRSVKTVWLPEGFNTKAAGLLQNWQSADALRVEVYEGGTSKGKIILTLDDASRLEFELLSTQGELILANIATRLRYVLADAQWINLLPIN
jgi:hypothetical protein